MKKKGETSDAEKDAAKAKKKTRKEGKKGGKGKSGIGSFALSGLVASFLLVAVMSLALAWLQFGRQQDLNQHRLAAVMIESQATLVSLVLRESDNTVQALAKSPLVNNVAAGKTDASALTNLLGDTQIHVVPANDLLADTNLSFTARELVQQARDGKQPQPALVPGKPAVLYTAMKTSNGLGVLLLVRPLGELDKQLNQQDLDNAHVAMRQGSGDVLFSRGNDRGGIQVNAKAPDNVAISLSLAGSGRDSSLLMLFALISGGGLLLVLLTQSFVFRAVSQAVRKDAALLVHYAQDLGQKGRATPRGKFSFPPLELITGSLKKLAQKGAAATPPKPQAAASKSQDSFTDIVADEDSAMLVEEEKPRQPAGEELPANIFRAYDIRGKSGEELNVHRMTLIGRAIGTEALEAGQQTVVVARDGRLSSPELSEALIQGLISSGRKVIDIGIAPTPVLYYASKVLDAGSAVCVTGSHNPSEYNGVKIVINGQCLHEDGIMALRDRIARGELSSGEGSVTERDVADRYLEEIADDIVLARPMKVVVDCANGVTGNLAPQLLEKLGCEVTGLYTDLDGNFPNHQPDPGQPENLRALIAKVKETGADLGLAFDGDGDRLGMVTASGEIIWPDRLMMLYARDLLSRSPGADIVFDVKCSRELARLISQQGGRPLMWKTGHSILHAKMLETGAPLAGEMSGHIFFADRWYGFDDALYAAGRLLEILSLESDSADAIFGQLKTGISTPELIVHTTDEHKREVEKALVERADNFADGSASSLDGLRVDFEDGWGLVRASNTVPALTARFEGRDEEALKRIQALFHGELEAVDPQLKLPF